MAAVVLEDFWKPYLPKLSQRQTQVLVRSVVVILGCICVGTMLYNNCQRLSGRDKMAATFFPLSKKINIIL